MLPSKSSHIKAVYAPRGFILHAALLHQAFAHCGKFPTAASRRSLDRVSVPVWLVILSDQLMIIALVSFYLTNKLIIRRPFPKRPKALIRRSHAVLDTISGAYPSLWGTFLRVTQPSAAPYTLHSLLKGTHCAGARLACIRHAASVHPEPGSNSPKKTNSAPLLPAVQQAGRTVKVFECIAALKVPLLLHRTKVRLSPLLAFALHCIHLRISSVEFNLIFSQNFPSKLELTDLNFQKTIQMN